MSELTITSQNVAAKSKSWQRKTFTTRLPHLLSVVSHYHPAIHLVQESGNAPYLKKLDATYKKAGLVRAPGGGRWRHIYYDPKKVRLVASGLLTLNATRTKHAAWARFVDIESGELLYVTSVHLSAGGEEMAQARYRQAEQLLRKSRPHTYGAAEVHGGDFNSYSNVGHVVFKPRFYEDALRVAHERSGRQVLDTFNGRNTVRPNPRTQKRQGNHLDHFYVNRLLLRRVTLWTSLATVYASDHNIIAVRITL